MFRTLLLLLFVLVIGTPAQAQKRWPGPFPVDVLSVLDGDTVEVRFRDGPCGKGPCPGSELSVRILGIDAPEVHRCGTGRRGQSSSGGASCAMCDAEWQLGKQAFAVTKGLVSNRAARVTDLRPDKYGGRIVANLEVFDGGAWVQVAKTLLDANLAVPYAGKKKTKLWCVKQ